MNIIARSINQDEKIETYFGIDTNNPKTPFVFGAQSCDQNLPSIAQWGAASTFGLDNLNTIDGTAWSDWRATLIELQCSWIIPIIENAERNNDIDMAVTLITKHCESMNRE